MSGLTLTVGGQALAVAPLSFKALKEQKDNIHRMGTGAFADAYQLFETMASIVHASLQRNAPGLTLQQVEEALDEPTAELLVDEVLRISFPALQPGEAGGEPIWLIDWARLRLRRPAPWATPRHLAPIQQHTRHAQSAPIQRP